MSFTLAPGEVLAVVGASGSGKSTLARLIVGATQPYAGKIRLDNADIHMWNREELGPHLGYLPQEVELFEGTVAENIARFGELDSLKIVDAAKRAGVHDMILGLPQGYETRLGRNAGALSGGQRQRIALARDDVSATRSWSCWTSRTRTSIPRASRRWPMPSSG